MAQLLRVLALLALVALSASSSGAAPQAAQHRVALPLLGSGGPRGPMGVEISWSRPDEGIRALGPGWVRRNGLRWADVEPVAGGGYSWDGTRVRELEAQLRAAQSLGLRVILVLQGSPAWAVAPYRADCAPIQRQYHDDFARFAAEAVRRYSAPPFGVKHWQIANEPDAYTFEADSPFGCWGQRDEPLYGGQAYGELLNATYPAIKAADPAALVLSGGLLLGQPYDPQTGEGSSGRFLEGMLEAGAGGSFDILAYHSYTYYTGPSGSFPRDWKPAYLRGILARYGLTKPLLNTEAALLCTKPSEACAQAQAYAAPKIYARAMGNQLLGFIWYLYDDDGFHHTALVEPTDLSRQRPAYRALLQAEAALGGLAYAGPLQGLPEGVEGHRLARDGRSVVVLWADTPALVRLSLGPGARPTCAAWDGTPLPCAADPAGVLELSAGAGPRYVAWATP